jgi:hypothetical protein
MKALTFFIEISIRVSAYIMWNDVCVYRCKSETIIFLSLQKWNDVCVYRCKMKQYKCVSLQKM